MSDSILLHTLFLFFFFFFFNFYHQTPASRSYNDSHLCHPDQTLALLQFKQNLISVNHSDSDPDSHRDLSCGDWLGSGYRPKMITWNINMDCCRWDGVTCNRFTGDVIGLDLSCSKLFGKIDSNSTLFHLSSLQKLNLAFNDFGASRLPHDIGRFANSLTHLNLSSSEFSGEIPSEISFFSKLVSLDLSGNFYFDLEPRLFNKLLQNFTQLRELSLGIINTPLVLPTNLNLSSLEMLTLSGIGLHGKLPDNILSHPSLQKLDLSDNFGLIGSLPKLDKSTSIPLRWLDLSWTGISGEIPDSIGNLKSLNHLDLSMTRLSGEIPHSITELVSLNYLNLIWTSISGEIPDSIGALKSLNSLSLSETNLSGEIPDSIGELVSLNYLDLISTSISGEIPDSIGDLKSLNELLLDSTNLSRVIPKSICHLTSLKALMLGGFEGSIPKCLRKLTHLNSLDLSGGQLNGSLPSWLFTLQSLEEISLVGNMLSGSIPSELFNLRSLKVLSLSSNQLVGRIDVVDNKGIGAVPQSFLQLVNLTELDLSYNNFTGAWELDSLFSSLKNLKILSLSYSGLSVVTSNANRFVNPDFFSLRLASCRLTVLPELLRALKNLNTLDLSSNEIHGHLPDWAGEMGGNLWGVLNLSYNFITGLPRFQQYQLESLDLKSNLIHESFPTSVCNMSRLLQLDMSDNFFTGAIPQCFGNISTLRFVDLGNNSFNGTIPGLYRDWPMLDGLILNGNLLQGEVPRSLAKCSSLQVLDLRNNRLNGTFPGWLGALPELKVLVLKSNEFHGSIKSFSTSKLQFPKLQILDLSQNKFSGILQGSYFKKLRGMRNVENNGTSSTYLYGNKSADYYNIKIVMKGSEFELLKILTTFTAIDLSDNRFEGEIPAIIGSLDSLKVLNLSHNSLTGQIPDALGNLSEIESLDLSWNQLTGMIPQQLAGLTSLEVLNLSQNHLLGRIPQGPQFNTFEASAFEGNPELCGRPLLKNCSSKTLPESRANEDPESGFTWKVVLLGYGCGTIVGLAMGYLMFLTRRPKWFNEIVDAEERRMLLKQKKRNSYI